VRLWSLHPKYLDAKGLVALWRETLLAQKVLAGKTKGYTRHPQLIRFRETGDPVGAVAEYLRAIVAEADARGYNFDSSKIAGVQYRGAIPVSDGQLSFELEHLRAKLIKRGTKDLSRLPEAGPPDPHPLFEVIEGPMEEWERV
jgi:hypothetical protein